MAGRIIWMIRTLVRIVEKLASPMAWKVPIWPTRPLVPMPAPSGVFSILKIRVDTGPKIAEARVGGSQIHGFLIVFGT